MVSTKKTSLGQTRLKVARDQCTDLCRSTCSSLLARTVEYPLLEGSDHHNDAAPAHARPELSVDHVLSQQQPSQAVTSTAKTHRVHYALHNRRYGEMMPQITQSGLYAQQFYGLSAHILAGLMMVLRSSMAFYHIPIAFSVVVAQNLIGQVA